MPVRPLISMSNSSSRAVRAAGWVAATLMVTISSAILWEQVAERRAGNDFRREVDSATQMSVNGRRVENPSILVAPLRLVDHVAAHHSHPLEPIRIDLGSRNTKTYVVIARDAERPTEFWAFLPGRGRADRPGQEAGRIVSKDLDTLMRQRGL